LGNLSIKELDLEHLPEEGELIGVKFKKEVVSKEYF
jgi:hypothetical protein